MISRHQPKRGFASVIVKETEREEEREKRGRRSNRTRILEEKSLSGRDVLTAQEKIRVLTYLTNYLFSRVTKYKNVLTIDKE